jgi:alpha-2-macroglobulin-like protein
MIGPDENLIDYVDDYVHGLLNRSDSARVARFCENSKVGQAALLEAQQRLGLLNAIPPTIASEELIQRTLSAVDEVERRNDRWWSNYRRAVWGIAMAALILLSVMTVHYWNLRPDPLDLRLLGQNQWMPSSQVSVRVAVWDAQRAAPQPGLKVSFHLYNPKTKTRVALAEGDTDEYGAVAPLFETPDWADGTYELQVETRYRGRSEVLTRPVKLKRDWRVMLTTDKPVYQPGQTIRLRSLSLKKPSLKPIAGEAVHFSIQDPKGNLIFKQRDVTSQFGIAATDCPLATQVIEGEYRIVCEVGGARSESTVRVQKYMLPKFKLDVTLDKAFYAPADLVRGQLRANYFFGKPVVGGQVQVEVRSTDFGSQQLQSIEATTDEQGNCEFSFRLPETMYGTESDNGNARFQLAISVTDTAGQQHAIGLSRVVASRPIQITVIPEGGNLAAGLANRLFVVTNDADGQPAACRVRIEGVAQELQTNAAGVAVVEIGPNDLSGVIVVRATDEAGRVGRSEWRLERSAQAGDFVLRPDRAIYTGGTTMNLEVLATGNDPIFVDLLKDGQSLGSKMIEVGNGFGELEIDLPVDLSGTVQIVAFRASPSGFPVRRSRLVLVEPAKQLQIEATLDQAEYRPGGRAKIQFQLRDEAGQPKPGALSLHAVDEAVYAVLGQRTNLEQAFFMLEQESLKPIFSRFPSWSPALRKEVPADQQAIWQEAVFSLTATYESHWSRSLVDFLSTGQAKFEANRTTEANEIKSTSQNPYNLYGDGYWKKQHESERVRSAAMTRLLMAWCALAVGVCTFLVRKWLATIFAVLGLMVLGFIVLAFSIIFIAMVGCGADPGFVAKSAESLPPLKSFSDAPTASVRETPTETPSQASAPRVRQWFPETLLWRPELITDDNGVAMLELDLADSITTWRFHSSAVSHDGSLGSREFPLKVFQSFFVDLNLPIALTRGDQVSTPVVLYNYLETKQTVKLTIAPADWFELVETGDQVSGDESRIIEIELEPGQVRSFHLPIRVLKVGKHQLDVAAVGDHESDAIRREVTVVPDGVMQEEVFNGRVSKGTTEWTLRVPADATPQSGAALLKLYPSSFSQLVEGLDGIFKMPYGCFEQTSSTTYPNVLALNYLREIGQARPALELKARQYIHLGYQRLLSFECRNGGFEWFGRDPGDIRLTAYGLLQFQDMSKVHDVDPQVIERARKWLLDKRQVDGCWSADTRMSSQQGESQLESTAYIAWAVYSGNKSRSDDPSRTLEYLFRKSPQDLSSPYTLALVIQAISAITPDHPSLAGYRQRLASLRQTSEDGKSVWWAKSSGSRTLFYGSGLSGSVETTALAALALHESAEHQATVEQALAWLTLQRDGNGTWHSTQATVLALKALLSAGAGPVHVGGDSGPARLQVYLDDQILRDWKLSADQHDVMQFVETSTALEPGRSYRVRLESDGQLPLQFQLVFRHHVPHGKSEVDEPSPFRIQVDYDRRSLAVNDLLHASATVSQNGNATIPMVMVDLPVPPGFQLVSDGLEKLVQQKVIEKIEVKAGQLLVYLRELRPERPITLGYQLRATMPLAVSVNGGTVYEYYDPAKRSSSPNVTVEVR